jgi:membrane protease YdiL (CAAX protease family)
MGAVGAFVASAYVLAGVLSMLVWGTGGHQSPLAGLGFAAMLLPAAAAAIVRSLTKEGFGIDWNRLPIGWVPVALFIIPVTLHATMITRLALAGPLPWQDWLTPAADGLYHSPESRGWGVVTTVELVARIVLNAGVGLLVVSALTLFEEIGWRGWLLPRLQERVGARLAVIMTAIIWGLWHVPFGLSGIQHVDGVSPVQLALGVPVGVIAAGLVIGWLWVRTESIWVVALAHGALNNWGQYVFKYMRDFTVPDPGSVIGSGFLGLYAVGILLLLFGMPSQTRGSGMAAA